MTPFSYPCLIEEADRAEFLVTFPDVPGEDYQRMWENREVGLDLAETLSSGNVMLLVNGNKIDAPRWVYDDAELYRTKDEVAQWKQRDPIALFQQQLRDEGFLTDADLDNMETAIATEIAEAVSFAEMGPWEPLEDLTKDLYTPSKPAG